MIAAQLIDLGTVGPKPTVAAGVSHHQRSVGSGRLEVCASAGKSRVARLYQQGCAKIRLPRSHQSDLEAIMINSSGGMTGGDRLDWKFNVNKGAQLTATTQTCERVYKSSQGIARTQVKLNVENGGRLNWLPQETILFDQGRFARSIEIDLEGSAVLLLAESAIFGRRSMGESVESGSFHDRWRVWHGGKMLHAEDFRLDGAVAKKLRDGAVADGQCAIASILYVAANAENFVKPCRQLVGESGGASFWNGKLLVRLLAANGYELRETLIPLLRILAAARALPKTWTN